MTTRPPRWTPSSTGLPGCGGAGAGGAGKTEMLSRVAAAVGTDRVLAVAPTAEAAANLGAALGVVGETAARAALSDDQVPRGGWVIVDEAGQLDTRPSPP